VNGTESPARFIGFRFGAIVLGAALGGLLCFGASLLLIPPDGRRAEWSEDIYHAGRMVRALSRWRRIPADAEGRIDVFRAMFGIREPDDEELRHLRHARLGRGPTRAQMRALDYRDFVWVRARVADLGDDPKAPLLWDPEPIDGKRVVGFRDGCAKILEEAEFQELMRGFR
jgi:hypothetical protein